MLKGEKIRGWLYMNRIIPGFGPKTLKLLSLYLTWFGLVTLRLKMFCFHAGFFESDHLKISVIKVELRRFIILYISKQRQRNLTIVTVLFFALSKSWEWLLSKSLNNSCKALFCILSIVIIDLCVQKCQTNGQLKFAYIKLSINTFFCSWFK